MLATIILAEFPAGQIRITPCAEKALSLADILFGLIRHFSADWGELDEHDWKQNDAALKSGACLRSRYVTPGGRSYWVITERDRSATTVLMPLDD